MEIPGYKLLNSANGKQLVHLLALLNSGKTHRFGPTMEAEGISSNLRKMLSQNVKILLCTHDVTLLPTSGAPRNLCVDILTISITTKRGVIK